MLARLADVCCRPLQRSLVVGLRERLRLFREFFKRQEADPLLLCSIFPSQRAGLFGRSIKPPPHLRHRSLHAKAPHVLVHDRHGAEARKETRPWASSAGVACIVAASSGYAPVAALTAGILMQHVRHLALFLLCVALLPLPCSFARSLIQRVTFSSSRPCSTFSSKRDLFGSSSDSSEIRLA